MKLSPKICNELLPEKSITKIIHLGSGKMGCVYKVTFDDEQSICVKILTKNHYTKSQDSEGWKCAYKDLDFKFQSLEDSTYFYFTIPYFEGQPFHYAIQYNLKSRFQIIQNLIIAIADIHKKEIIHRDLTCNNIIINKDGNKVNIIDFGRSFNIASSILNKPEFIQNLQLPEKKIIPDNIKIFFQPYTAPEYFKNYNASTVDFHLDYYSVAQLFKFLIPEYSYLANEVISTEGSDRNNAFENFSKKIDDVLRLNESNPNFNEPDKAYYEVIILYKRLIFFIKEIFCRLFNLTSQACEPTKTTEQNTPPYIGPVLFKQDKLNRIDIALPRRNTTLYN